MNCNHNQGKRLALPCESPALLDASLAQRIHLNFIKFMCMHSSSPRLEEDCNFGEKDIYFEKLQLCGSTRTIIRLGCPK